MKKYEQIFILVLTVIFLLPGFVYAGIMVEPSVVEKGGVPGTTYTGEYKVINPTKSKVFITIEPEDWLKRYLQKTDTIDVKEWLTFSENQFEIEPGEFKKIAYTVTVPKALVDEQAAQIFFSFREVGGNESMRTRLGVVYYLGNEKKTDIQAEIKEFTFDVVPIPDKENATDINFGILIENKGNVHVRPFGVVRIQKENKDLVLLEINPEKAIYPNASELISAYVREVPLPSGAYDVIAEISCDMYGKKKMISTRKTITIE